MTLKYYKPITLTHSSFKNIQIHDVDSSLMVRIAGKVNNNVNETKLSVFPNPVKDQVSIRFANEESRTLLVTDLKGKVILNEKYQSDIVIINTTELPSGKYNIQSIGSVNNKSETSSFIKLN